MLVVYISVNSIRLKESIFETFVEVTFVGGKQFDFAIVRRLKELAKALNNCICVIKVIFNLLRFDSRIEERS